MIWIILVLFIIVLIVGEVRTTIRIDRSVRELRNEPLSMLFSLYGDLLRKDPDKFHAEIHYMEGVVRNAKKKAADNVTKIS
jgi:hypothetical protein